MTTADVVERGRQAYERRAWGDAYAQLRAADERGRLEAADLERLAIAAYLTGRDDGAVEVLERAHNALLNGGHIAGAVRCAFWIGMILFQRGQLAPASGWMGRAQSLLDEASLDCVERGYLLIPPALQALMSGDPAAALPTFEAVSEIADRFADPDLRALGRLGRGQALVAIGEASRGVGMLDEAMVAVTTDDVSPIVAGIVYCAVIIACRDIFDVRRAEEWTEALSRWCDGQQDLRPYRGQCLVHRSEIMQLRGDWSEALEQVQQACAHLSDPPGDPVIGMAQYQQGELLRLQGAFRRAEEAYRQASRWGHPVQPGLALLRLAQGRVEDAETAIRRVVDETDSPVGRSRVLAAYVEIMLAAGDVGAARTATDELQEIAADFDTPYLRAITEYARGAVTLAEGDAPAACVALRRASRAWQELAAPYEAARTGLVMAEACMQLDDRDTAEMELDAARRVFEDLRAAPALARVHELSSAAAPRAASGLTPREIEVLSLVASGATNRDIADTLVISEKTVARHVSNLFTKLGVSSRSAATAYAYEHELV